MKKNNEQSSCKWETVLDETDKRHVNCISRIEVPGGWIYRFERLIPACDEFNSYGVALQFVPRPQLKAKVSMEQ